MLFSFTIIVIKQHRNGNAGTFKMGVTVTGVCFSLKTCAATKFQIRNVQRSCTAVRYCEILGGITTFFLQEN